MRVHADAPHDSALGVTPSAPWRLVFAEPLPGYRLTVRFRDGLEGTVDMSRLILGETAGVFQALRDQKLFEQLYLEHGAVTWPGGLDLAPDAMYAAIKRDGEWVLE